MAKKEPNYEMTVTWPNNFTLAIESVPGRKLKHIVLFDGDKEKARASITDDIGAQNFLTFFKWLWTDEGKDED